MAGNACKDFFLRHAGDSQKVKALQQVADALAWENESASDHSPGPVASNESVIRQVTHPNFVDDENKIKPIWFDDVMNRGLSTDRLSITTVNEVVERARRRADERNAKPENAERQVTVHSLGKLSVEKIRRVRCGDVQAFGVYDTGLAENPAHADVCQLVHSSQAARSVRYELFAMTELVFV
ncbi:hypothetical protein KPB05_23010 [Burkholderia gladioli]|uniref:hypothetical protein n=1 Tax=Burkholderia gladioli TaxID=28095 RepID=UPI00163E5407|nr:hypothetical protein [Burkholderia gladioli]MDR8090332.1 hypothetical protein [Burkholderia gladioli]